MVYEFKLPDLGEGITTGEIKKWNVRTGQHIVEDETIAEIETDKAVVELPSPVTGTIEEIRFPEGSTANVGDVLATIKIEGMPPVAEKAEEKAALEAKAPEAETPTEKEKKVPVLTTPATRMLAKELGVDINRIKGTGPDGRITDEDVRKAAGKAPEKPAAPPLEVKAPPKAHVPAPGLEERIPLKGIRRTISDNMMRSLMHIAPVTLMDDVDITELESLKDYVNGQLSNEVKINYLAITVKAVVAALRAHPSLNASIDDDKQEIVLKKYYNIGIAVDTDRGLIVPVLKDADKKNIMEISRELKDIIELTRDAKIGVEQLHGGTFTIANIGSIGGLWSTPIINYPESAVLEMQQARDMPRVCGDNICIRKIMNLCLTVDHRIVDGAEAQRFLNEVKRFLEDPKMLFVGMV